MEAKRRRVVVLILGLGLVGLGVAAAGQDETSGEGFESGDLSRLPWVTGGDAPWAITPISHSGAYAVQAGKVGDGGRSWLEILFTVQSAGEIWFWYKVSSEEGYDFLLFFVDGELRGRWSGETDWTEANVPLAAGTHSIRWEYAKDGSVAAGSDTAWLDDIVFPGPRPTAAPPPDMVLVPAGSFQMGDSFGEGDSDERPVHTVYVSTFYMDKYEVTKALWDEVAAWAQAHGYDIGPSDGSGKAPNHPVCNVSWYEAVKWLNARSEKEGRTPAYNTSAAKTAVYRTGQVDVQTDWVRWDTGYRLPTEAEWERAARGGCEGHRFPWCDSDTITHSRANYESSSSYSYDTSPTRGYHPDYDTGYPLDEPGGELRPERVRPLRHGGERLGVVLGLVELRLLRVVPGDRPPRPGVGLVPGDSRRQLEQQRQQLPRLQPQQQQARQREQQLGLPGRAPPSAAGEVEARLLTRAGSRSRRDGRDKERGAPPGLVVGSDHLANAPAAHSVSRGFSRVRSARR